MKNAATNWKFAGEKGGVGRIPSDEHTDPGRQPDPGPFYLFNKRRIFFLPASISRIQNWERISGGEHAPEIVDPISTDIVKQG